MEEDPATVGSGYPITMEALDLEIYELVCLFAASHELRRWAQRSSSFDRLRIHYERSEASRRLIALAATLRNFMDSWTGKRRSNINRGAGGVGVLIEDLARPTQKRELLFREACNKLVHAERIVFDVRPNRDESLKALRPFVHLYGTKDAVRWKARLDVVDFLRVASGIGP